MSQHFELVVIGTGPAASRITEALAEKKRTAVIENRPLGGTCALRGCNPKKVLVRAAELVDQLRRFPGGVVEPQDAKLNWQRLIDWKNEFTDPVPDKSAQKLEKLGVTVFHGTARFTASDRLVVGPMWSGNHQDSHPDSSDRQGQQSELQADQIVICTGATPAPLPFTGAEHVISSDDFLDLKTLPPRVLFIGGGYVSMEFASVALRAGAEVRVIDHGQRVLKGFEADLVEQLVRHSQDQGMHIMTQTQIRNVEAVADHYVVHATQNGQQISFETDLLIHGAGRIPNVSGLDPDAGQVRCTDKGIEVNQHLQSVSNPRVYAAGDVVACDQPPLTPVANQQARTVLKNLLEGNKHTADYGAVPRVVFSIPSLAAVGLTEAQARQQGLQFEVRYEDMSTWGSVRKVGATAAAGKVLVDTNSDRILGAHMLGPAAAETINLFALAMKFDLTATDVKSTLFAFPTFASDVRTIL